MKYDIRVNLTAWALEVEAENEEDALRKVQEGRLSQLFPNDINIDDVVEISYGGKIYRSED